jgi:glutamate racemase
MLIGAQGNVFHTIIVYTNLVHKERSRIGVFDSGFGGLTVLKALLEAVPNADYLYFGDTARLPYGSKSADTVARYACEAARFLEQQGAGLLVIACNTATALALPQIRQAASVEVVGVVEPGAQQAASVSKTKKAVVIGTEATISSHAYRNALAKFQIESHEKACPLLVPLVEEGWTDHSVTKEITGIYMAEAFADGFSAADVLLLGCTHYPLLKPILQKVVPEGVTLVDSAESTAHAVAALLSQEAGRRDQAHSHDSAKFFVTDSAQKFQRLGKVFLGRPMTDVTHVELKE